MKITFKRINGKYVVTANGCPFNFTTSTVAWKFIGYLRKECR